MSAEKVREYLLTHGISYEIHEHPLAYTTSRVAEEEHVSGKAMAKPVILLADDHFVMAVVPGHRRVDLEKARQVLGCASVRMATEEEFAPAFTELFHHCPLMFFLHIDGQRFPRLAFDAVDGAQNDFGA